MSKTTKFYNVTMNFDFNHTTFDTKIKMLIALNGSSDAMKYKTKDFYVEKPKNEGEILLNLDLTKLHILRAT